MLLHLTRCSKAKNSESLQSNMGAGKNILTFAWKSNLVTRPMPFTENKCMGGGVVGDTRCCGIDVL